MERSVFDVLRSRHAGSEQVAFPLIGATQPLNHRAKLWSPVVRIPDQVYVSGKIDRRTRLDRADEVVLPARDQHVQAAIHITADQASTAERQFVHAAEHNAMRSIVRGNGLRGGRVLIVQECNAFEVLRPCVRENHGQPLAVSLFHTQLERVIPDLAERLADESDIVQIAETA